MRVTDRRTICSSIAIVLAAVGITGCGGDSLPNLVPIEGEVLYNGEPLTEGTVIYLPAQPGGRQATGPIGPKGQFTLMTLKKNDGVMRGDYQIAIYAYEPHPGEPMSREEREAAGGKIERGFIIPEKYADGATSGLTDKVDEDHSGFKRIELVD